MLKLTKIDELPKAEGGSKAPTFYQGIGQSFLWFSSRDSNGHSYPQIFDITCGSPILIKPYTFPTNRVGTAYDSGIMPSHLTGNHLLFTGWNAGNSLCKYRNSMLKMNLLSGDVSFITDRCDDEQIGTSMPFLWNDELFYMSFRAWSGGESIYDIKSVRVDEDFRFVEKPKAILKGQFAYARPWVESYGGETYLWYCYRHFLDFRTNPEKSYRLGVLRLEQGEWIPEELDISSLGEELMQAYPCVDGNTLYYNNGFDSPIQVAKIEYRQ